MIPHLGQNLLNYEWEPGPRRLNPLLHLRPLDFLCDKRALMDKMELDMEFIITRQAKVVP